MDNTLGIYIHIPFCVKKCPYCDFYSIDLSKKYEEWQNNENNNPNFDKKVEDVLHFSTESGVKEQFLWKLCEEIREKSKIFTEKTVDTIYFGGGTPSILEENDIKRILDEIKHDFSVKKDGLEVVIEINPGTVSTKKMENYLKMGISVTSIGVQSLSDDVLRTLDRIHNKEQAVEAFKMARNTGFKKISIDLMFAIPGQTMEMWIDTVKQAIELNPQHISLYSLEFMEGTKFDNLRVEGKIKETDADIDRMMYETALDMLEEAGYIQYEISNCAKPGFESKHNMKYWNLSEYIGFGPSAHSYYNHARYKNPASLEEYISNPLNSECYSINSIEDDIIEYTFTGLRKAEGIKFSAFSNKFGKDFWEFYGEDIHNEFSSFVKTGYAEETENGIHLTRKGFNISNRIMKLFV